MHDYYCNLHVSENISKHAQFLSGDTEQSQTHHVKKIAAIPDKVNHQGNVAKLVSTPLTEVPLGAEVVVTVVGKDMGVDAFNV